MDATALRCLPPCVGSWSDSSPYCALAYVLGNRRSTRNSAPTGWNAAFVVY